jgi:hypothetical protein
MHLSHLGIVFILIAQAGATFQFVNTAFLHRSKCLLVQLSWQQKTLGERVSSSGLIRASNSSQNKWLVYLASKVVF